MEKRKTFHGRQVGKKRLLPIVFPLFLFLLIPLNGYGDDTPMPEVVQQNSTRITGVVKDAYGEPVIGANVKVVGHKEPLPILRVSFQSMYPVQVRKSKLVLLVTRIKR